MSAVNKAKRTRDRPTVVCSTCKKRKKKCDRQKPCSNCIKSSLEDTCSYNDEYMPKSPLVNSNQKNALSESVQSGNDCASNVLTSTQFTTSDAQNPNPPHHSLNLLLNPVEKDTEDSETFKEDNESDYTILDIKFDINSSLLIIKKPSRTFLGLKFLSEYFKNEHLISVKFFFSLQHMIKDDKNVWKSQHFGKKMQLEELQYNDMTFETTSGDNNIAKMHILIEKLVCANYCAILERLRYFQANLNKILFNLYMPMGVVQLIFHYYFNMKREGVVFNKPKKIFEYSLIALITSLVELTNIFTKFEPSVFNFPLPQQNNEFNELSVMLLNASNYRKKCSIFGVYTLLNLRLSLMIYGDAQSPGVLSQNTYPFFQSAVNMCIEMGINLDQDKEMITFFGGQESDYVSFEKDIPLESIKRLWNYLLILDASYYTVQGCPPFIDDRYSHGIYTIPGDYSKEYNSFVTVVREVSLVFTGINETSFREIFSVLDKITILASQLGSLEDFRVVEKDEGKWLLFTLKFKLLRLLSLSLYHVSSIIKKVSLSEKFSVVIQWNEKNKEIIENIKRKVLIKCRLIYFISMNTILKLTSSNMQYNFLHYIKDMFSNWIGIEAILFADTVVNLDIKERNESRKDSPKYSYESPCFPTVNMPILETKLLENALYDFNTVKYAETINAVEQASKPEYVVTYMSTIYEKLLGLPFLLSDFKFFVTAKLFLIALYSLHCCIKVTSNIAIVNHNFNNLKNITRDIIAKNIKKDVLSPDVLNQAIINDLNKSPIKKDDVIHANTVENIAAADNVQKAQNSQVMPFTVSSDTVNVIPQQASPENVNSRVNDLTTAIFEDEEMMSIFNDIDNYFNF